MQKPDYNALFAEALSRAACGRWADEAAVQVHKGHTAPLFQ